MQKDFHLATKTYIKQRMPCMHADVWTQIQFNSELFE